MISALAKGLVAGAALLSPAVAIAQDAGGKPWWWDYPLKLFSQPSESMMPTIQPVSTFLVYKRAAESVRRGDIIAFRKDDQVWVMRVVALPGDRIAMAGGLVSLNGQRAIYGTPRPFSGLDSFGNAIEATQMHERLEGEAAPHDVLDLGKRFQDDTKEVVVAKDHVFVLGDNRDNASDSRFPAGGVFGGGAGQVAFDDIYGAVDPRTIRWMGKPSRSQAHDQPPVIIKTRPVEQPR